jgi:TonB family protein
MNRAIPAICVSVVLLATAATHAADGPPASAAIIPAHTAWTTDPVRRCPELRVADEGAAAVVVFFVNAMGAPSRATIRTSSGSAAFDAAAIDCVMKLRFQVATRFGDGVPVESWQSLGWRQVAPPQQLAAAPAPSAAPAAAAASGAALTGAATAGPVTPVTSSPTPGSARTVGVRACADSAGRLMREPEVVHSSGDAAVDAAAVKIAKSGAGYYRPAAGSSGCAQLQISFE